MILSLLLTAGKWATDDQPYHRVLAFPDSGAYAIQGSTAFLGCNTDLKAIDLNTGQVLWSIPGDPGVINACNGKQIMTLDFAQGKDFVSVYSIAEHKKLWSTPPMQVGYEIFTNESSVFLADHKDNIYCFDASTGSQNWMKHYQSTNEEERTHILGLFGDHLLIDDKANIYDLDPRTARERWHTGSVRTYVGDPAPGDGETILIPQEKGAECLRLSDGKPLWSVTLGETLFHTQRKGNRFFAYTGEDFLMFNADTGKVLLKQPIDKALPGQKQIDMMVSHHFTYFKVSGNTVRAAGDQSWVEADLDGQVKGQGSVADDLGEPVWQNGDRMACISDNNFTIYEKGAPPKPGNDSASKAAYAADSAKRLDQLDPAEVNRLVELGSIALRPVLDAYMSISDKVDQDAEDSDAYRTDSAKGYNDLNILKQLVNNVDIPALVDAFHRCKRGASFRSDLVGIIQEKDKNSPYILKLNIEIVKDQLEIANSKEQWGDGNLVAESTDPEAAS